MSVTSLISQQCPKPAMSKDLNSRKRPKYQSDDFMSVLATHNRPLLPAGGCGQGHGVHVHRYVFCHSMPKLGGGDVVGVRTEG